MRDAAFHLIAELDQVSLDLPVRRVHTIGRRGVVAGAGNQLVEQLHGGGLDTEHGPEHVDHRRPVRVRAGLDQQARCQLVRRIRRPRLPCLDHRGRGGVRPDQVEPGRERRRDGIDDQGRDHAEGATTGAPECPEQVRVMALVALEDATIRQNHARPTQLVAGQSVSAAEDAQSAAEGQSGDPDRRATARGNGQTMPVEGVVELPEPGPGTHRGDAICDGDRAHRRDVHDHTVR